jgi:hypothetical protein
MNPKRNHPHGGMLQGRRPYLLWKVEEALMRAKPMMIPMIKPGR